LTALTLDIAEALVERIAARRPAGSRSALLRRRPQRSGSGYRCELSARWRTPPTAAVYSKLRLSLDGCGAYDAPASMGPVRLTAALALVALAGLLSACGGGEETLDPQEITEQSESSVVHLQGKQGNAEVIGTGVVFDAEKGLVLTNAHLITGVSSLKAKVAGGTEIPARVIATAPCDDLAVVELNSVPEDVTAMPIGESGELKSGETVTALGYPENLESAGEQSLVSTTGNVSSVDVSTSIDPTLPAYPSLVQHQATINPGNSGGPLVNEYGELVGINTLGYQGASGEVQDQSYAISIDHIEDLLPDLRAGRSYADLGWELAPVSFVNVKEYSRKFNQGEIEQLLEFSGLDEELFVRAVTPGSPVSKAHIHFGDLVKKINGTPVKTVGEVCDVVQSAAPGSALRVRGSYFYTQRGDQNDEFYDWLNSDDPPPPPEWIERVRVPAETN
jgi:S1-C subfamily serine protease